MATCMIVDDEPLSRDVLRKYISEVRDLQLADAVIGDEIVVRQDNVDPPVEQEIQKQGPYGNETHKENYIEQVFLFSQVPGNEEVEVQVGYSHQGKHKDQCIDQVDLFKGAGSFEDIQQDQEEGDLENQMLPPPVPEDHQVGEARSVLELMEGHSHLQPSI